MLFAALVALVVGEMSYVYVTVFWNERVPSFVSTRFVSPYIYIFIYLSCLYICLDTGLPHSPCMTSSVLCKFLFCHSHVLTWQSARFI